MKILLDSAGFGVIRLGTIIDFLNRYFMFYVLGIFFSVFDI